MPARGWSRSRRIEFLSRGPASDGVDERRWYARLAPPQPGRPPTDMLSIKTILLALLALFTAGYIVFWGRHLVIRARTPGTERASLPTPFEMLLGAVTNFFDTLGI